MESPHEQPHEQPVVLTEEQISAVQTKLKELTPPNEGETDTVNNESLMCIRSHIPEGCTILTNTCNICMNNLILTNPKNICKDLKMQCDACSTFVTDIDCIGCIRCGVDICLSCITPSKQE